MARTWFRRPGVGQPFTIILDGDGKPLVCENCPCVSHTDCEYCSPGTTPDTLQADPVSGSGSVPSGFDECGWAPALFDWYTQNVHAIRTLYQLDGPDGESCIYQIDANGWDDGTPSGCVDWNVGDEVCPDLEIRNGEICVRAEIGKWGVNWLDPAGCNPCNIAASQKTDWFIGIRITYQGWFFLFDTHTGRDVQQTVMWLIGQTAFGKPFYACTPCDKDCCAPEGYCRIETSPGFSAPGFCSPNGANPPFTPCHQVRTDCDDPCPPGTSLTIVGGGLSAIFCVGPENWECGYSTTRFADAMCYQQTVLEQTYYHPTWTEWISSDVPDLFYLALSPIITQDAGEQAPADSDFALVDCSSISGNAIAELKWRVNRLNYDCPAPPAPATPPTDPCPPTPLECTEGLGDGKRRPYFSLDLPTMTDVDQVVVLQCHHFCSAGISNSGEVDCGDIRHWCNLPEGRLTGCFSPPMWDEDLNEPVDRPGFFIAMQSRACGDDPRPRTPKVAPAATEVTITS